MSTCRNLTELGQRIELSLQEIERKRGSISGNPEPTLGIRDELEKFRREVTQKLDSLISYLSEGHRNIQARVAETKRRNLDQGFGQ